jgi:hypothetical protein
MAGQWDITGWKEEIIPVRKHEPTWPKQAQESGYYRGSKPSDITFTNEVKFKRDALLLHASGWCTSYITRQLLHRAKDYGTGLDSENTHALVAEITNGVQSDPENNGFQNILQIDQAFSRRRT